MSLLKKKILDSAMRFFSEKGYASTSIQDIANDCGIAKGSLYKFFASKEDLLMEVYGNRVQRMYDAAETIKADQTLSPRDRFIRETVHQLEFFAELKFSIQEYQDLPLNEDLKFVAFCTRLTARQLDYYKDCLFRAYGSQLETHVWDLVVVYLGIMREFTHLPIFINQPVNLENVAIFTVDRMDEMAAGILNKTELVPILQPSHMLEYVRNGLEGASVSADKQKEDVFRTLISTVQELAVPNTRKAELTEAAQLLHDEAEKDQPKTILMRALLEFLQTQYELRNIVGQLNRYVGLN